MNSRVPIPCPECHQIARVRSEYIGLRVQCQRCGHAFAIPRTVEVACPGCGLGATFRTEDLGRVIRCNRCDSVHEAMASVAGAGPTDRARAAPNGSPVREKPVPAPVEAARPATIGLPRPHDPHPADDGHLAMGVDPRAGRRGPTEADTASAGRFRDEDHSPWLAISEAGRLEEECRLLKARDQERAASEEAMRGQMREIRSELERLVSEAASLRDRATTVERLEEGLRMAREEVMRLRGECQEARAAAVAATHEVEAVLTQSSLDRDGLYRVLGEIEKEPAERLIGPSEAERLRTRLAELEGHVAEAVAVRRMLEEDFGRRLRAREGEVSDLREELRDLQGHVRELARLEAEERELRALQDQVRELAALEAEERSLRSSLAREPVRIAATATKPADDRFPPSPGTSSTGGLDLALELIDIRDLVPRPAARGKLPAPEPIAEAHDPTPGTVDGPSSANGRPDQTGPAADPEVDPASPDEPDRLKAEVLALIYAGRKDEAEVVARRMVDLMRATAGELSKEHATWMTVVGQLQAEQGRWDAARATFRRKNALFRDHYGELDPRHLACLADSADALLACGDRAGARDLFEQADELGRRALDTAHPFAIAIRRKLDGLRGHRPEIGCVQIST